MKKTRRVYTSARADKIYKLRTLQRQLQIYYYLPFVLSMEHICVIVYVDFSKALDVVSRIKLFIMLHCYGIRRKLLCWLKKFLFWSHPLH